MDCIQWIPYKETNQLYKLLDNIYHHYSIYRTIIVCRNKYCMNEIYKQLKKLEVPSLQLHYLWQLQNFRNTSTRILIINFSQYYEFKDLFNKYIYDENNLFLLEDLSSLQEQFCIDQIKQSSAINNYIYVN